MTDPADYRVGITLRDTPPAPDRCWRCDEPLPRARIGRCDDCIGRVGTETEWHRPSPDMRPSPDVQAADFRVGITIPLLVAMVVVWVAVIIAFTAFAASSRTPATPSPAARTGAIPERVKPMPASPVVARTQALGAMLATASGSVLTRGLASWYADGPGLYGAVHSYRWGDPTYPVIVCRADDPTRCVTVTVRDHMANPTRAIDLSPAAFSRLGPLSAGVVVVTVAHGRGLAGPTLPPTHTIEGGTPP